jgi:hypothetical protein
MENKIKIIDHLHAMEDQSGFYYGVFCVADRMQANGYEVEALDEFFFDAKNEYTAFLLSEFNVNTKSELDCIDDYFFNK